ncbi:DUF2971 domain-containing protein [bacterium]|nr:DUF2971 domain-containing protein [bacterium]
MDTAPEIEKFTEIFCNHDDQFQNIQFYHYCDFIAGKNIISNKNVWATYIKHSNDSREFIHGMQLFIESIKKQPDDSFIRHLYDNLKVYIEEQIETPAVIPYIFCFSEAGDLLSQWRGYANNGNGLSVGFTLNQTMGTHVVRKVIYNQEEQNKKVEEIVSGFQNLIDKISPIAEKLSKEKKEELKQDLFSACLQAMIVNSCFFKDENFSEEKEWRIVFFDKRESPSSYRVSGGNLITYTEQSIDVNFNKLIYGPKVSSISKQSFKKLISNLKLSITDKDSKIPFQ